MLIFVRLMKVCLELSIFIFLSQVSLNSVSVQSRSVSGQSQFSLRSVSGQAQVSLRSELTLSVGLSLKYFVLFIFTFDIVFSEGPQ